MAERYLCPGHTLPGQCLNVNCVNRRHDLVAFGHSDIVEEAEIRRRCLEKAKRERDKMERVVFLKGERRKMGMESFMPPDDDKTGMEEVQQSSGGMLCPSFGLADLKTPDAAKTMREPVRPACMLQPPDFTPPTDDYHDLSRFLRISTMAGYNINDQVSEYRDNHNMAVWNNRKDIDPQLFKMKRDWLSVWGEFNVKEQCWRKAWTEKFGSH